MRMTNNRRKVLDVLKKSRQPLSADLIFNGFEGNKMDLSTVYRALEVLYENGLVAKSNVEGTSYYHLNEQHHHHFIMCLSCKKMVELDCHLDHEIEKMQKSTNFKIIQHDLTFYGYCADCALLAPNL